MIKTNELTGTALDWAVAVCESLQGGDLPELLGGDLYQRSYNVGEHPMWAPSEFWAQGGPIIEREMLNITTLRKSKTEMEWKADTSPWLLLTQQFGPTPLIAAMRCYVASKLGDEIDIPKELL